MTRLWARRLAFASGLRYDSLLESVVRGYSSAGRALAWHARGRRFDPAWLHQIYSQILSLGQRPHRLEAQDTTLSR